MDQTARLEEYCNVHRRIVGPKIGHGIHGSIHIVYGDKFFQPYVVKVFNSNDAYERERTVYRRIREADLKEVGGCIIPTVLNHDDGLQIIEMTLVSRPFALDFAGAYLDQVPQFPPGVSDLQVKDGLSQFTSGDREKVETILGELRSAGIHQLDPAPENICVNAHPH